MLISERRFICFSYEIASKKKTAKIIQAVVNLFGIACMKVNNRQDISLPLLR